MLFNHDKSNEKFLTKKATGKFQNNWKLNNTITHGPKVNLQINFKIFTKEKNNKSYQKL